MGGGRGVGQRGEFKKKTFIWGREEGKDFKAQMLNV